MEPASCFVVTWTRQRKHSLKRQCTRYQSEKLFNFLYFDRYCRCFGGTRRFHYLGKMEAEDSSETSLLYNKLHGVTIRAPHLTETADLSVQWRAALDSKSVESPYRRISPVYEAHSCTLAAGWTVRGSNSSGVRISVFNRPSWGSSNVLYNGYCVFQWGKAAGAWCWPPTVCCWMWLGSFLCLHGRVVGWPLSLFM